MGRRQDIGQGGKRADRQKAIKQTNKQKIAIIYIDVNCRLYECM